MSTTSVSSDKLRLLFVTQDDPFYVIQFFDVFFAEYPRDEFQLVGITIAAAFRESRIATTKRMLRFYGLVDFGRVLTRFVRARLRGRSIAARAERERVPLLATKSVNDPTYVDRIRALAPDVIVSVAAPEIFEEELLAAGRIGCLNIHSGRLPTYRGMMPTFWQMLAGERQATITVHEMAPQLDAGAVLGKADFPLRERDSLDRVMTETKHEGARLMIEILRQVRAAETNAVPLDMREASYFSFPTRADVARFRARGHRLV